MEIIGLLIVACLGYIFFVGYNKAKTRRYHAVITRAKRDLNENNELYSPTWINNADKRNEFISVVKELCLKHGVSNSYLDQLFSSEEFLRVVVMKFTALLEQNKLSFTSQMTGSSDLIVDMWNAGVELPPSNAKLLNIISFIDSKISNNFDAACAAVRLYLDANFIHAVNMFNNSNAVSFEQEYGHTISNEAKAFLAEIDVTNSVQYMELNYQSHTVNLREISRYISSFSNNRSSEELRLKLWAAEHIIKTWKLR
ncbi:hypothetical protein [Leclercia adecarboxylata]|uniref:hypothetical protein n=1 Tax=Leclercia adecarboxylata TaxID=83655 RepID=UPI00124DD1F6|nr:hypothetical protein [Leclercia adecarboxylata]QFH49352.1 hypothetical protein FR819_08760 [Leclercia adecarboxylata]